MTVSEAQNQQLWDSFLSSQRYGPFLQSWTMGEVYRDIGEEPIRLEVHDARSIVGICQAITVPARRGKHLAVLYGPVISEMAESREQRAEIFHALVDQLKIHAREQGCIFIRMSPFLPTYPSKETAWPPEGSLPSPLHVLAEHVWYLPLVNPDPWDSEAKVERQKVDPDQIFSGFRATTRNLIRRAEKEGVTVETSEHPEEDIEHFLRLHEETRKRHGFTPYSNAFFRAQVAHFAPRKECTLYLARYQGDVIASSIHMHTFGETSYHHGASSFEHRKIPASTLLQWTAICDALAHGDHVYNFWGIAPQSDEQLATSDKQKGSLSTQSSKLKAQSSRHPFAGVTLFKTGFGGKVLTLEHSRDIPLSHRYRITRAFEQIRKWRRGF